MPEADDLRQTQTQTVQSPLGKSVTSAPTCNEHLLQIMNGLNTAPKYNCENHMHAITCELIMNKLYSGVQPQRLIGCTG